MKCQLEWAHQHAHREPIVTLGMAVTYLSGIFEILSYPHKLEITTKKVMTNLKKVAEIENEPVRIPGLAIGMDQLWGMC